MHRILINHHSPLPNKITGVTAYTWSITKALVEFGAEEYVLSTNWNPEKLPSDIKNLGIEITRSSTSAKDSFASLSNSLYIPKLARDLNCSYIFHPQPVSMLWGLHNSTVVVHDLYLNSHASLYPRRHQIQWTNLISRGFRSARNIIAVSTATRDAIKLYYPEVADRVVVVHEAPVLDGNLGTNIDPLEIGNLSRFIGTEYGIVVANITPNKNISSLLKALDVIGKGGSTPKFLIVGRDESSVLAALLLQYKDADIEHVQNVSDSELSWLYRGARVFINTSLVEGFCLPVLEAQSFGVPVICSDLPVLREVAGAGAIFIDPQNTVLLAEAIQTIFADDSLRRLLSDQSRANVANFSWRKAATETESVIIN